MVSNKFGTLMDVSNISFFLYVQSIFHDAVRKCKTGKAFGSKHKWAICDISSLGIVVCSPYVVGMNGSDFDFPTTYARLHSSPSIAIYYNFKQFPTCTSK